MYCSKPKKEAFVSINKLIVLGAAFILASLIGSTPAAAVTPACDPAVIALDPLGDCDGDGIPNNADQCDNLDESTDCDGDGVFVDACPYTNTLLVEDLVVGACTISGLDSTILLEGQDAGCSLIEALGDGLDNCETIAKNHGKYVSCVARLTNYYKKRKYLTGAEKGYIQSCAAQSDFGKKPHP
jgi:hypothetical protein